jgi:HTH-type transcriptional regulator/antitoxin HigA
MECAFLERWQSCYWNDFRHNRLRPFAFTLFHELGHIYEHLINNNNAGFIDLDIKMKKRKEYKIQQKKKTKAICSKQLIDKKRNGKKI